MYYKLVNSRKKAYSDCIKCNETKAVTILIVNFYV